MYEILAMGLDEDGQAVYDPITDPFDYLKDEASQREDKLFKLLTRARSGKDVEERLQSDAYPEKVGWTILVNEKDPDLDLYKKVFTPLARRRKMINEGQTVDEAWLVIDDESVQNQDWTDWIQYKYIGQKSRRERPRYVLILGDVDQIPLGLQIDLSIRDFVGRLAFEDPEDYRIYVEKLERLETSGHNNADKGAFFLSTKHISSENKPDPTHYTSDYLVPELIKRVEAKGIDCNWLSHEGANKDGFIQAIQTYTPSLVFTASHGQPPRSHKSLGHNMRYGGAIQFPASKPGQSYFDKIFSADDVDDFPKDKSLFEGSVFFQFACFGYGTPAASDYSVWDAKYPFPLPGREYISDMPRRLLAHPRGPVAYIGHLDQALVKSIVTTEQYNDRKSEIDPRIMPFGASLTSLVSSYPAACSMLDMKESYLHGLHEQVIDTMTHKRMDSVDPLTMNKYVDKWLVLTDAKNYLVFGDPAARISLRANY